MISVRENKHGRWWANTTHKGYDVYVEGTSIDDAKTKMSLELNIPLNELVFDNPKMYVKDNSNAMIGYRSYFIDIHCRRRYK